MAPRGPAEIKLAYLSQMNSGQAGVLIPWTQIKSPGRNQVNQGAEIWSNVDLFWAKTTIYY